MLEKKFAGFVITFERADLIKQTLEKLFSQSHPPEYILVIDNSFSSKTSLVMEEIRGTRIGYQRMGYNGGPAGAAKFGLQKLYEMGFEWIYWGDDDDPPTNLQAFQEFFTGIEDLKNAGIVPGIFGGKGGYLNKKTGRIRSLANFELERSRFPEVDSVPGGHTLLVNADVVKQGILPNEALFFGFEELDFCLRVKEKGFKVMIDADAWLRIRAKARNSQSSYQWKSSTFGRQDLLWREYYSSRNLLVILFSRYHYRALAFRLFITVGKSIAGFKFGWKYGSENLKIQWKAIFDFFLGRFPKPDPDFRKPIQ